MKITVECNNIAELRDFVFQSGYLVAQERVEEADKAAKESKKFDRKPALENDLGIPMPEKKETKATEPEPAPEPEAAPAKAEVSVEDIRTLGREVNKKAGSNLVKEWLKELGYKSLADVKDPGDLAKLKEKAEAYLA